MGEAIVLYRGRGSSVDPELLKPTTITSNGTYTAPVTGTYRVSCVGGGGGGGGGCRNSWNSSQVFYGAGGTRGSLNTMNVSLNAGDKVQVNLGSGGAGGTNNTTVISNNSRGTNGGSGGTTTFGSYVSGAGGSYGAWSWSRHVWSNIPIWNNWQSWSNKLEFSSTYINDGRIWATVSSYDQHYTATSEGGTSYVYIGNYYCKVSPSTFDYITITGNYINLTVYNDNRADKIAYKVNGIDFYNFKTKFLKNNPYHSWYMQYNSTENSVNVQRAGGNNPYWAWYYKTVFGQATKTMQSLNTMASQYFSQIKATLNIKYNNEFVKGMPMALTFLPVHNVPDNGRWNNALINHNTIQSWNNRVSNTTTRCYTSIQQGSWWYTLANNVTTSGTRSYRGDGGASGQAGNAGFILIIPPQSA